MPLQLFGDFGFAGGFDTPANQYQDSQTCINFYPEIAASKAAKEAVALLGCPGLVGLVSADTSIPVLGDAWAQPSATTDLPVRGLWSIPDAHQGLAVIGKHCYLVTKTPSVTTQLTLYQSNFASATLSTANQLLPTLTPVGSNGQVTIQNSYTDYSEITSQDSASWSGAFSIPAASGNGFLWDTTALEGNTIPAQTWTPSLSLLITETGINTADTLTADVYFRMFKRSSGGSYTQIVACKAAGIVFTNEVLQTVTVWTSNTSSDVSFSTGDQLYMDVIFDVTANGLQNVTSYISYQSANPGFVMFSVDNPLSLPIINLSKVGKLKTTTGYVSIRDNGLAGVAVMVDGPYGYYYVYGSAGSAVGPIGTFTRIIDSNFVGADRVAFIDGWWIFNQPGTQLFYTNAQPYSTAFNASYYAYKDAYSDLLIGVMESKEELWLLGSQTTEIWYDAGGQYFPFERLVGTLLQVGCKAAASISRYSVGGQDGLIWLGSSDRGQNVVIRTMGFSAVTVSTQAVSDAITQLTTQDDAIGYTYEADGHEFYVLTFPTDDVTWVYDGTQPPELAWHQRLSYDPYAQQFHRHRSNAYMPFDGLNIVGDYQNGCLYNMTRTAYSDAAWPILAQRRSPFIWTAERTRVFMNSLQIEFAPGVGNASGTWTNPQAELRISRDYGTTYGPPSYAPIGMQGNFLNRCMFRKLGFSRGAVVQIQIIDPVRRDIVGATLRANSEPPI